jgi:hypothetical protein
MSTDSTSDRELLELALACLRSISQMSRQAKKGQAHVAKLTLDMMADLAAEAIAKVERA